MDTIEELKYYCNEPYPVGALMLTGEWGCGKTYLINNTLEEELKTTHVILRVSLFGIESVEELHKEVKKCWVYALAKSREPISGISEKAKKAGGVIKTFAEKGVEFLPDSIKTIANGVLSLDVIDFVKIEPLMEGKRVVLVFDDLERKSISIKGLLGCINDYCENQHISTIVVANEEKINPTEDEKKQYDEIKEKIIQRTIRYTPDYSAVVSNVISSIVHENEKMEEESYGVFLENNEDAIHSIFSGASIDDIPLNQLVSKKYAGSSKEELENEKEKIQELLKHRPHNIRSLKCAIQDFRRVYSLLVEKHIDNKEKWLFTYLSYVLCFRAGLIPESSKYGTLFSDEKVSILYPGFYDDKYITSGIKQWIRHGEWENDALNEELNRIVNREKAITPEDKARTYGILDLDEADMKEGYPRLLEKAYAGTLELDDYVNLLCNSCLARKNNIQPFDIDWEKLCNGISVRIATMLQEEIDEPCYCRRIGEDRKEEYLPKEWNAYKIIDEFLSANTLMFKKNKALYVGLIKTEPLSALIQTQNKRFDIFDIEMAEATAMGFEAAPNAEKNSFIDYFKRMWQANICSQDYKIKLPEEGFQELKNRISQLLNKYQAESLSIAEVHTRRFLETIDDLISEQKQRVKRFKIRREKQQKS